MAGAGQAVVSESEVLDALEVLYNAAAANSLDATTCEALRGHLNLVRNLMLADPNEAQQRAASRTAGFQTLQVFKLARSTDDCEASEELQGPARSSGPLCALPVWG